MDFTMKLLVRTSDHLVSKPSQRYTGNTASMLRCIEQAQGSWQLELECIVMESREFIAKHNDPLFPALLHQRPLAIHVLASAVTAKLPNPPQKRVAG